jgi:2-methylcitrate dehydratase PrpD
LLASEGVEGPPGVIEARDGFMQAFAYASPDEARPILLPPDGPWGMTDCYIKPNPCCRHIQPATEALIGILQDEGIATEEVQHVSAETYRIAAEHAGTGWDDFASSQLSFRYLMALALKFRAIRFEYFEESVRNDPTIAPLAAKVHVSAPAEIDRLYPRLRPARVTVTTSRGTFVRQADEALGSRLVPFDDDALTGKFHALVVPALGDTMATNLARQLWTIDNVGDVAPVVEAMAKPSA